MFCIVIGLIFGLTKFMIDASELLLCKCCALQRKNLILAYS